MIPVFIPLFSLSYSEAPYLYLLAFLSTVATVTTFLCPTYDFHAVIEKFQDACNNKN